MAGPAIGEEVSTPPNQEGGGAGRLGRGTVVVVVSSVLGLVLVLLFYFADRNSDRYELRCIRGRAEARQGLFFPWGTRHVDDDAHAPLELPVGLSCATTRLPSLDELDALFGGLLLEAAEHRLTQGGPEALARARDDIERATRLGGLSEDQRRRADALLADMVYHEAREILRQVERDLWQARRKLERARALGAGQRIGDLDEWLGFVAAETERFRPAMAGGREGAPTPDRETPEAPPARPSAPAYEPTDTFL